MRRMNQKPSRPLRPQTPHRAIEPLESRTLLSATPADIRWLNVANTTTGGSADTDGFGATFGSLAPAARAVVHALIDTYEQVIGSFNYSSSSTFYGLTLKMDVPGTGFDARTNVTATSGNKPRAATITIDGGNDDGNPNSDKGWFIDPTPYDSGEFLGAINNAFSGEAPFSSPAADKFDLFSVAGHEIAHAMGLGNQPSFQALCTNTGIADFQHGGIGTFWVFRGPSISHLMTSSNGGGDSGVAKHTANAGAIVQFDGETYIAARDIANANSFKGTRNLVSNTLALMLKDAYGYSVNLPQQFQTMYATINDSTGQLIVRGGDAAFGPNASSDVISIWWDGLDVNVSVNVSNDIPGTGHLPGAGDLGPFVTKYRPFLFQGVSINSLAGDDLIFVESVRHPTTVEGSGGNDQILVGGGDYDANVLANLHVDGGDSADGGGFDVLSIYDINDDVGNDTHNVDGGSYGKPGAVTMTSGRFETMQVLGSSLPEAFNIRSTHAIAGLHVEGRGGDDQFYVGDASMDDLLGGVDIVGGNGNDRIFFRDGGHADPAAYTIDNAKLVRAASGIGNATYSQIESLSLATGTGGNTINLNFGAGSPAATIAGGNGDDVINIYPNGYINLALQNPISLSGGNGNDTINFNALPGATTTLFGSSFESSQTPTYLFFDGSTENLNVLGSAVSDVFIVRGTVPSINTVINASNGNDKFYVGSTPDFAFNMDGVDGPLTINGQNGIDSVVFSDAGSATAYAYTQTATTLSRAGMATVNFGTFENVSVIGSSAPNTMHFLDQAPGTQASFDGGPGLDTVNVNTDAVGQAELHFTSRQDFAALNIGTGGRAVFDAVDDNTNNTPFTLGLSIANGGKLDLMNNDLILDYTGSTPMAAIRALINAARNGGEWNGSMGITSSVVAGANPRNKTLGVIEGSEYDAIHGVGTPFSGWLPDATSVLVKYTYYGDADFDGMVTFDDYVRTDAGFNTGGNAWTAGDFDGSGTVDFDDYVLIDLSFNTQIGM